MKDNRPLIRELVKMQKQMQFGAWRDGFLRQRAEHGEKQDFHWQARAQRQRLRTRLFICR